jgi:diguanylate cyclase (GGDEF)-like protein
MARHPGRSEFIGKSLGDTPLFQWRIKQAPEGVFRGVNPLDGASRLFAYKVIDGTGMVALVGLLWDDVVVADWRQRALQTAIITLISFLIISVVSWWGNYAIQQAIQAHADRDEALSAREKAHDALHHAQRDHLTGLPSRALFLQEANRLREHCGNAHDRMAVLIIDLDGFKGVNDTYGHDKGDEVLVQAGSILLSALRESDVAGRLGGDEFGVCISAGPEYISIHAQKIAGRIVERMAAIGMGIGCSIGVSICPTSCEDLPCALHKADEAMYEAKRAGKNQFVVWGTAARRDGAAWPATSNGCAC